MTISASFTQVHFLALNIQHIFPLSYTQLSWSDCRCNTKSFLRLFLGRLITIQYGVSLSLKLSFFIVEVSFTQKKVLLPCTILFDMQTVCRCIQFYRISHHIASHVFDQPTKQFNVNFIHYELLSTMLLLLLFSCFVHSFKWFAFSFEKFEIAIHKNEESKQKLINSNWSVRKWKCHENFSQSMHHIQWKITLEKITFGSKNWLGISLVSTFRKRRNDWQKKSWNTQYFHHKLVNHLDF